MKIALVAQHATPLRPRAGSGPDSDDIGLSELTRRLATHGHQVTLYAEKHQPDLPEMAELRSGVRVEHINAGPVPAHSEQELVTAIRAGDDRAFEELYALYRERIFAFILSKVHDHGRAEDIAQEVFMSALRRLRGTDRRIVGHYHSLPNGAGALSAHDLAMAYDPTAIWIVIAYYFHQSMIDAVTGGREIQRSDDPRLYTILENLCISRGIPTPKLKVIDSDALNAFATGMNAKQYSITVTTGLLHRLNDAEIESVLGHELTHIRNGDVRMMVVAVIIVGVVVAGLAAWTGSRWPGVVVLVLSLLALLFSAHG